MSKVRECGIQDRSTDIVKIDIDTIRAGRRDRRRQIVFRLVVDRRIEPKFRRDERALFWATRDTDDTAPFQFCHLASDLTNTARSTRDKHCFTGFNRANFFHTEPCGQRRRTQRANPVLYRTEVQIDLMHAFRA